MPNYNEAQGVADLLSQFDFNIISEGPGDFSTSRKYTCEFSKPGIESFTTTYQSNPRFSGQPTATDVFAALASDALAVDGRHIDDFADEMGFEKPSQAIRAYESCRKTLDWLKNGMQLMTSEISDIAETLGNEMDEVKEEVERVQAERKAKHEFEHPPVPEASPPSRTCRRASTSASMETKSRTTPAISAMLSVKSQTPRLTSTPTTCSSGFPITTSGLRRRMPKAAGRLQGRPHQDDQDGPIRVLHAGHVRPSGGHRQVRRTRRLKEAGVYALADEVYDDVFDGITIDFNDNNMDIEDFATEVQTAIQDAMDSPLYDALGSNDEILEDGELSGDFEAIKESGYDFPNPCAMSAEAVRTVNEKGYETAFNEFWKEFMPDKGYEVPTVSEAAQESREASGKLEQDSHDGQTPEREDERADGDAEH